MSYFHYKVTLYSSLPPKSAVFDGKLSRGGLSKFLEVMIPDDDKKRENLLNLLRTDAAIYLSAPETVVSCDVVISQL